MRRVTWEESVREQCEVMIEREVTSDTTITEAECEQIAKARVGQGKFKDVQSLLGGGIKKRKTLW